MVRSPARKFELARRVTASSLVFPNPIPIGGSPYHIHVQRRWARVRDVRFVTTRPHSDLISERYKTKLNKKALEYFDVLLLSAQVDDLDREGHTSIDSLKEAYHDKISELRDKEKFSSATSSLPPISELQKNTSAAPQPRAQPRVAGKEFSSSTPGIKPLSAYLDLNKVSELPQKELEYIWRLRHASDPRSLCAVIPFETYNRIYQTAKIHPQFILPLPRPATNDGADGVKQTPEASSSVQRNAIDVHFLQWGFHPPAVPPTPGSESSNTHTSTVIFTHLASFKVHGAYSRAHTTITHHLDLADSHGLVLLNGAVVDGGGVSAEEARWLLMCLQKFYDLKDRGVDIGKKSRNDCCKCSQTATALSI